MPERTFNDSSGTEWLVYDCAPAAGMERGFAPELKGGWLCFQSASEKRRLVDYPQEWERYAPEHLEMLLEEAAMVSWVSPATGIPRFESDATTHAGDEPRPGR